MGMGAFRERDGDRREWALKTLRTHQEAGGVCAHCAARFGNQPSWPCPPVRVAEQYSGFTPDLRDLPGAGR